jgi:cardiolipin synthase
MTPYIGDERAAEALVAAKKRGVDVRVIVPGLKVPNNKTETKISKTFYADLLKQGIPIYGFERMMHAKAWLSDDRLTVGSTNLSRGGLRWYKEMSASVEDAGTSAKAVRLFQNDFLSTPQIQLDEVTTLGTRLLRMVRKITGLSF